MSPAIIERHLKTRRNVKNGQKDRTMFSDCKLRDRETGRQRDRETERQSDRETETIYVKQLTKV